MWQRVAEAVEGTQRELDPRLALSRPGRNRNGADPALARARRPRPDPDQFAGVDRHADRPRRIHALPHPAAGRRLRALRGPAAAGQAGNRARAHQVGQLRAIRPARQGVRDRRPTRVHRIDELRPALARHQHRDRHHHRQPADRACDRRALRGDRPAGQQLPADPRPRHATAVRPSNGSPRWTAGRSASIPIRTSTPASAR